MLIQLLNLRRVYVSNASLLDLDCSDLSGWIDGDTGPAVSDQGTFDGEECFTFDTNSSAAGNYLAKRSKDVGSVDGLGNFVTISLKLYCDAIGVYNADPFELMVDGTGMQFIIRFTTDSLYHWNGSWNKIGTDLVSEDIWQEWSFGIDVSGGAGNASADVYLEKVKRATVPSFDISGGGTDGLIALTQYGFGNDDRISYLDYLKIGDGFA